MSSKVNSWDCFDTLVARRRFTPFSVFDEIGEQNELPDFTERRRAAEARAPLTLDGIYDELAKDYGWNKYQIDHFKDQEIEAELRNCCPINETLSLVQDGDLIVSDMYLPEWVIKKILINCGLKKDVKIYVETGGKSSGKIWTRLPPINQHIGDNYYSDVKTPKKRRIKASLYTGSQFTELEQQIGGDLALLMRIVRLANPYRINSKLYSMWLEQSQLNIPALILTALELPKENVAFIMRDCVHLQPIHQVIHGTVNASFHCSRMALKEGLPSFRQYVEETALGKTLVDIHGTGVHILDYWKKNFRSRPDLIYVSGVLQKGRLLVRTNHDSLERFNSSPLGSIGYFPHRKKCEFDKDVLECQQAARDCAISHIPYFQFARDLETLELLIDKMLGSMTCQKNIHIVDHELVED